MNGRTVILQASRKIPRAIGALLEKHRRAAAEVGCFLMHQANQNLTVRIAEALGVGAERFYSNIRWYGNTSSASMFDRGPPNGSGNRDFRRGCQPCSPHSAQVFIGERCCPRAFEMDRPVCAPIPYRPFPDGLRAGTR